MRLNCMMRCLRRVTPANELIDSRILCGRVFAKPGQSAYFAYTPRSVLVRRFHGAAPNLAGPSVRRATSGRFWTQMQHPGLRRKSVRKEIGTGRIGGTENRIEFLWKISQLDLRPRPELSGPMLDFSNRSGLPSIALWQALLTQSNYPSRARLHSPNCVRSWRKSVGYR